MTLVNCLVGIDTNTYTPPVEQHHDTSLLPGALPDHARGGAGYGAEQEGHQQQGGLCSSHVSFHSIGCL